MGLANERHTLEVGAWKGQTQTSLVREELILVSLSGRYMHFKDPNRGFLFYDGLTLTCLGWIDALLISGGVLDVTTFLFQSVTLDKVSNTGWLLIHRSELGLCYLQGRLFLVHIDNGTDGYVSTLGYH